MGPENNNLLSIWIKFFFYPWINFDFSENNM